MSAGLVQVIWSDDGRQGKGIEDDCMRSILRLYTTDGQLICEFDIGKTGDGSDSTSYVSQSALQKLRVQS